MSISYASKVSKASRAGAFFRLLLLWKGSLYKAVFLDYLMWLVVYFIFSAIYRFVLGGEHKLAFETWCFFCTEYIDMIPLAWVLAFFVSLMVRRWWSQWEALPWPDVAAIKLNYIVAGEDDHSRLIRRSIIRYANLCIVLMLRGVSSRVKKRFPTYNHIVKAGLMTDKELDALRQAEAKSDYGVDGIYWVPISWATVVAEKAWRDGFIKESRFLSEINNELIQVKVACRKILGYHHVNVPLVYTQVVTFGLYFYLMLSLFARQYLRPEQDIEGFEEYPDYVFPMFSSIQLIFYVGWLKVAESLANPFGEDDDDFDSNWLIDRGYEVSLNMVDHVRTFTPSLEKDIFWNQNPKLQTFVTKLNPVDKEDLAKTTANVLDENKNYHNNLALNLDEENENKNYHNNLALNLDEENNY